jgi:hypothetical protein
MNDRPKYHVPCPHCGRLNVFAYRFDETIMLSMNCEVCGRSLSADSPEDHYQLPAEDQETLLR